MHVDCEPIALQTSLSIGVHAKHLPHDERQLSLALGSERNHGDAREDEVLAELRALDPARTTPMDALLALQRWRERLEEDA